MEQGWLRMEKIDTDCKQRILKSLAKLFKPFNRDWAPLTIILRNRAEYRLILSRRGRRPSRLKSDDIPQDWAG